MKQTLEEAVKSMAYDKMPDWGGLPAVAKKYFIKGAEWQSKQSPWISVKERLPEKDGYYFVTDGDVIEKVYFFERWNKFASTRDYPHLFYDEVVIKAWFLFQSNSARLHPDPGKLQSHCHNR